MKNHRTRFHLALAFSCLIGLPASVRVGHSDEAAFADPDYICTITISVIGYFETPGYEFSASSSRVAVAQLLGDHDSRRRFSVSPTKWKKIVAEINEVDFESLPDLVGFEQFDTPEVTITVISGPKFKRVKISDVSKIKDAKHVVALRKLIRDVRSTIPFEQAINDPF